MPSNTLVLKGVRYILASDLDPTTPPDSSETKEQRWYRKRLENPAACLACGKIKPIFNTALHICASCSQNYFFQKRLDKHKIKDKCSDCHKPVYFPVIGRCSICFDKWYIEHYPHKEEMLKKKERLKKLGKFRKCKGCGLKKEIYALDNCKACYQRARKDPHSEIPKKVDKVRECEGCKLKKPIYATNKCINCYQKAYYKAKKLETLSKVPPPQEE